jgi:hypothetical protein
VKAEEQVWIAEQQRQQAEEAVTAQKKQFEQASWRASTKGIYK